MASSIARRLARLKLPLSAGLALAGLAASLACGGGSSPPPPPTQSVGEYLTSLPGWSEYSPILPDEVSAAGAATEEQRTYNQQQYICATTPYRIQKTPAELVMYSPNVEILWPGSLLQGRSYREGTGMSALLPLTIAERVPIKVSIPKLTMGTNFREVVPDQANVASAVSDMVATATVGDLATPASVSFDMEAYHSEQEFALKIDLSGKYMGFEGSANFTYDQAANETTVVVHYMEKMFEVVVAPPQTPDAFFSAEFTREKLDQQIALDRIGPGNVPIYVSNVVYGRMFTFAMTSTKSELEIRAALQAAYDAGGNGGSGAIDAKYQEVFQNSRIAIISIGGLAQATVDVIQSGDWTTYFNTPSPLSAAVPLSYTFRSLGDGQIAAVTETTTYNQVECSPVLPPGFGPPQAATVGVAAPFDTAAGDINGDGRVDLVWNHHGQTNDVRVAFGKRDGTFDVMSATALRMAADPAGTWIDFKLVVADMNGDGKDDLVWNRVAGTTPASETYVALSNGTGGFSLQPLQSRSGPEWGAIFTDVEAARVQAKAGAPTPRDLLWTWVDEATNTAAASASVWDASGSVTDLPHQALTTTAADWRPSASSQAIADLTGDGADDLVWSRNDKVSAAVNDGNGTFTPAAGFPSWTCGSETSGWARPCTVDGFRVADVTGDQKADVVRWDKSFGQHLCSCGPNWNDIESCDNGWFGCYWYDTYHTAAEVLRSDGAGGFTSAWYSSWTTANPWAADPLLRDVTGDGRADLVWVDLVNPVYVRPAMASGGVFTGFNPTASVTDLPVRTGGYLSFRHFFGDVNGDGITDLVLADESAQATIYVLIMQP